MKALGHRKRRMSLFYNLLRPDEKTRILDIGGTTDTWEEFSPKIGFGLNITLLNLRSYNTSLSYRNRYTFMQGNALYLPFKNKSFDIVFSNSMIDHLYSFENQQRCANEIRRVGKQFFVQTGNRNFFFEPHFLTPFIPYFTKDTQKNLIRRFTLWGLITRPTRNYVNQMVDEIILSTKEEFESLFPEATIIQQKIFGFTKSFIAVKK